MKLHLTSIESDQVFVRVEGSVTPGSEGMANDPLEKLLGPRGYSRAIVVNLQKADFIDSSGVAWLLGLNRRTREAGGILGICALPPQVSEVLRVSRIDKILTLWTDEAEARAALAARAKP
jgi:anti-anti-sigma factor